MHDKKDAWETPDVEQPPTGLELIILERERQITKEGWTSEHDSDEYHSHGEMAMAAACYAVDYLHHVRDMGAYYHNWAYDHWPWDDKWWNPSKDPIRNLTKAGALIAAEIDRLQRQGK